MTGRVSFIIPVRNDARRLATCLASIKRVFAAVGRVEIIVVDHDSTDESGDVARRLGARVIRHVGGSVAGLRNLGAREATGDVLAFVDADHEIAAGWVTAALDTLRMPNAGAVGALCRPPVDGTWVQRAYGFLRGRPRGRHDVEWLGSGNLAVLRTVFEALGGFDTTLEACEDVDLCGRIRAAGYRVISDARLDNIHYGDPATLGHLFRSELWRGRDNLRVTFRGPLTLRSLPSALIPVVDLAAAALAIGALPFLAAAPMAAGVVLLGSLILFAAGAAARVWRAAAREAAFSPSVLIQTFVIALVYDAARACALLMRAPHRSDTTAAVAVTP